MVPFTGLVDGVFPAREKAAHHGGGGGGAGGLDGIKGLLRVESGLTHIIESKPVTHKFHPVFLETLSGIPY